MECTKEGIVFKKPKIKRHISHMFEGPQNTGIRCLALAKNNKLLFASKDVFGKQRGFLTHTVTVLSSAAANSVPLNLLSPSSSSVFWFVGHLKARQYIPNPPKLWTESCPPSLRRHVKVLISHTLIVES
jgi:hypothetical protein